LQEFNSLCPRKVHFAAREKEKDETRRLRFLQSGKLRWLRAAEAPITIKKNVVIKGASARKIQKSNPKNNSRSTGELLNVKQLQIVNMNLVQEDIDEAAVRKEWIFN